MTLKAGCHKDAVGVTPTECTLSSCRSIHETRRTLHRRGWINVMAQTTVSLSYSAKWFIAVLTKEAKPIFHMAGCA